MSYRETICFQAIGLSFEGEAIIYPGQRQTWDQPGYDDELEFRSLKVLEDGGIKTDAMWILTSTIEDQIAEGAWAAIAKNIASAAEDAAIAKAERQSERIAYYGAAC
jgi:hypothetical protein